MPSKTTSAPSFHYTYVLQSLSDGEHYVGYTTNLSQRFTAHQEGRSFATRPRGPWRLIYFEGCRAEADAQQRERYLKTTAGRRFLAKRLRRYRFG